jgi:hypothetical protein
VQERILQPDGSVEEVFCYSGNAWRGQLRDLSAAYMLDRLGGVRVGLDTFHLLFSGGRIGGAQDVNIAQARAMRAAVPHVAVWGGGVGNQILAGKLRVGNCYPVCREAIPVLPERWRPLAERVPYAACTQEKEHSRRDDAKIDTVRRHLAADPVGLLLGDVPAPRAEAKRDGPADQMRIGMELVTAGVTLHSWIALHDATEVELGALVAALHSFAEGPSIGGKVAIGYGLADLDYALTEDGGRRDFLRVSDGVSLLSPEASAARDAYDQHLRGLYDAWIDQKRPDMTALLGAG